MLDYTYLDEDDFNIKKQNRRAKIDKRMRAKEDFMKVNNIGVKKVILPLLEKKARQARNRNDSP